MNTESDDDGVDDVDAEMRGLGSRIRSHDRRRTRAQAEGASRVWSRVAIIGTLGWSVSLPPVGGALLGHWLDQRFDGGVLFALLGLGLGAVAGGYSLWRLWGDLNDC